MVKQMPNPGIRPTRPKAGTYAGYSLGCAAVWAGILAVAQRRLDAEPRHNLWLWCAAWWSGWTSATIARAGYPPPSTLSPQAEKRLGIVSLGLVALGLASVVRFLVTGQRAAAGQDGSA